MEPEMTQKAHFRKKYDTLLKKNLAALLHDGKFSVVVDQKSVKFRRLRTKNPSNFPLKNPKNPQQKSVQI